MIIKSICKCFSNVFEELLGSQLCAREGGKRWSERERESKKEGKKE